VILGTGDQGVQAIRVVGDHVWLVGASLMGRQDAFRLQNDHITRFEIADERIADVVPAAGRAWLLTVDGQAYHVQGEREAPRQVGEGRVSRIIELNGRAYAFGQQGAWRIEGDQAIALLDGPMAVTDMRVVRGDVWLLTEAGVYRMGSDRAVRMSPPASFRGGSSRSAVRRCFLRERPSSLAPRTGSHPAGWRRWRWRVGCR
jgi:hypothetical protein